jgi:hypothetical protein
VTALLSKKVFPICLIVSLLIAGCGSSEKPNYSGEGACSSLESLINQIGFLEIQSTETLYAQLDSIISQAENAGSTDSKYVEMSDQVEMFKRVWIKNFPNDVPSFMGAIPLQLTSDDFCGTDYEGNG